jgi:hypothetical protein
MKNSNSLVDLVKRLSNPLTYQKFKSANKLEVRDNSVGIATCYGLDGPGIEYRWGRGFPLPSRPAMRPTHSPVQWVPGLSRGQNRPGRGIDNPPHLAPRLKKE